MQIDNGLSGQFVPKEPLPPPLATKPNRTLPKSNSMVQSAEPDPIVRKVRDSYISQESWKPDPLKSKRNTLMDFVKKSLDSLAPNKDNDKQSVPEEDKSASRTFSRRSILNWSKDSKRAGESSSEQVRVASSASLTGNNAVSYIPAPPPKPKNDDSKRLKSLEEKVAALQLNMEKLMDDNARLWAIVNK
jgi:hypothetical protein